jgi:hypothetical protein
MNSMIYLALVLVVVAAVAGGFYLISHPDKVKSLFHLKH